MNTRESDFWNERAGPRIAAEHFGEILTTAADIAIVVGEGGTVVSATTNPLNSAVGKVDHWVGRNIRDFVSDDSIQKLDAEIRAVTRGQRRAGPVDGIEINHEDNATWAFPVRYTLHATGLDGRILMLGRDLRPIAELQQRLVRAQMALERDYEAQRDFQTRFRVVMEAATDAMALVDVNSGRVLDANGAAARLMGATPDELPGTAFAAEFAGRRRGEFLDALQAAASDGTVVDGLEVRRSGRTVALHPRLFRAGGERILLLRMTEPGVDGSPAPADPALDAMRELFRASPDALVVTDRRGCVGQANEAFLVLCDAGDLGDVRGRPLSDFLGRGGVDARILLTDTPVRGYVTRVTGTFGTPVPVEITAAPLVSAGGGHGLVVRDTGRAQTGVEVEHADIVGGTVSERAMKQVMDQVGSAPLKEIVASTTDVIEKACIETAIELTGNNRVAAAEMLGLSRQSLYVKLRKYGILTRDG